MSLSLKIFHFSSRIFCMFARSSVIVALFSVTTFPVVLQTGSDGFLESGMQKFSRQSSAYWILNVI